MLCALSRWMISRAEDSGKKLPGFVERHIRRCPGCGAYARDCASLTSRLRAERDVWLARVPDFVAPAGLIGEPSAAAPAPRRPWFALRPLPAVAAALAVVAGVLVLSRQISKTAAPSEEERAAAMEAIRSLSAAPSQLPEIAADAESPLMMERQILERSLSSAVEFLQDRLNIKIERRRQIPPSRMPA
jgi:hypothetical protein